MRKFSVFSFLPLASLSVCLFLVMASSCSLMNGKSEESVAFDTLCVDSIVPLFEGYENPVLTINVSIERPVSGCEDMVAAIGEMINSTAGEGNFFGQVASNVPQMVDAYIEDCIENYNSVKNDYSREELEGSISWLNYEAKLTGRVASIYEGFISYEVVRYAYNGGPHGQTIINYGVYDQVTRQRVGLANLVDYSTSDLITELLQQKLAMTFDCESFDDLLQKGILFPDSNVGLTENFYFDAAGITWLFNAYEIAPYAVGDISVIISWDELESLLPAESVAMRLFTK